MAVIQELLNDLEAFNNTPQGRGYDLRLDLSSIIVRQLDAKGWTQKELADRAGVKEPFITRLIHAGTNCTFETAGRILFALGVRAELKEIIPRVAAVPQNVATSTTASDIAGRIGFSLQASTHYGEEDKSRFSTRTSPQARYIG